MSGSSLIKDYEWVEWNERCTAVSKQKNRQCKNQAIRGGFVCYTHGGGAKQVIEKARKRLKTKASEYKKAKIKIYLMESNGRYKVGVSVDPEKRKCDLETGSPFQINLLDTFEVSNPIKKEQKIHKKLSEYHAKGEWFTASEKKIRNVIQSSV